MPENATTASTEALLGIVREDFGRVAYSHKTHQKMLDRLNFRMLWEKRINALLLALTAGDTVGVLVTDGQVAKVSAVVLSAVALLVTIYGLSRSRERLADQHRRTALALWALREDYVHLVGDLKSGSITLSDARARRDTLTKAAARIYGAAPDTDAKAYQAAQRALKTDEELTFSDPELDVMLPRALRSGAIPGSRGS